MIHERKSMRLAGYDYATPGAYFITTCVHDHKNEFGIIENGTMKLNEYGLIVEQQCKWLFDQYDYLKPGEYCVMPNHFHGIIQITPRDCDLSRRDEKIKPIPELTGAFKATVFSSNSSVFAVPGPARNKKTQFFALVKPVFYWRLFLSSNSLFLRRFPLRELLYCVFYGNLLCFT